MSWFKKLTKRSHKSSKHQPSLAAPPRVDSASPRPSTELYAVVKDEGIHNGQSSRTLLPGSSHQQSRASGASTPIHGREDVTLIHEKENGGPSNTPNEQPGSRAPGLSPIKKGSEDRDRRERNDQGAVAERPTEIPPARQTEIPPEQPTEIPKVGKRNTEDVAIVNVANPDHQAAKPGFGSLKASLSAIPANHKEIVAIDQKIEILLSRIEVLEECFDSRPNDRGELNRRRDVIQKFEDVEGELRFYTGEIKPQRDPGSAKTSRKVSEILEDIRETIFDYQIIQQTAIYEQITNSIIPAEATILNGFRSAQGAEYRHGDRKGCLKGTRAVILVEIMLWTRDFYQSPVYWLNGLAGTGKSTIAQTIAERTFADGRLGASFFCSRDFEDRNNLRLIFPTIAVQLARKYPEFRSIFIPLVQSDPGIAHESLYNQMDKLIVRPLAESAISTVIVIDALDECKDEETTSAILSVLGRLMSKVQKVKFFLTGRPEPRIQTGFRLPLLKQVTDVFVLHDVERKLVTNDIYMFFKHSFFEIASTRGGLEGWPTDDELDLLCTRAAGLFVYAVATVKFIDKWGTNPRKRLDLLLQSPEGGVHVAKMKFKTNTSLDTLYTSILREAFGDDSDPDYDPKVRSVLGAVLLAANPLSPTTIATLLNLDVDDVFPLLSSAQSLLILEDADSPVRAFHKSFPDFITDPDRCTNKRFYISPLDHHSQLLIKCLDLMDRTLKKNICQLPDGVANSDVTDLKERTELHIDPPLQYACKSWHKHLVAPCATSVSTPEITSALHRFLETKFMFWLEVLSVLGSVRTAVDALQVAAGWLEESPTLDLVNDCSRFVTRHFDIISTSSPHIYLSALVLTPKESIVQKLFKSHVRPFARVVHGVPALWDSNAAVTTSPSGIELAAWSMCNRFIAISSQVISPVDILDSTTLQRLQSLGFPQGLSQRHEAITFSPDSRLLTSFTRGYSFPDSGGLLVTWDLQTGGIVSTIEWKGPKDTEVGKGHITYLTNGKTVAVLSRYKSSTTISVYDVHSGEHMHDVEHRMPKSPGVLYVYEIWAHEESLRFATPEATGITIWEAELVPGATPKEVETVSVPGNTLRSAVFKPRAQTHIASTKFHPASCRLAFIRVGEEGPLVVWDARTSKVLLHHKDIKFSPTMTFSDDARYFSCTNVESEVYLWKESLTGYTLFEKLTPATRYSQPRLSPNGGSIVTFSGSMIQLWHATGHFSSSSSAKAPPSQHTLDFLMEFLPDRPLALVTQKKNKTVTVLDLKSGTPRMTIDTSIEVYGLRSIGNTIVVIGYEKAMTWDLPEGDFLPDAKMDAEDSTRTIHFGNVVNSTTFAASISLDYRYIALSRHEPMGYPDYFVDVYCTSTGRNLRAKSWELALWFAPGGYDVWCAANGRARVFTVTSNELDHTNTVDDIEGGPHACPWGSPRGYRVTDDGWVIGAGGKRLLMLPPLWLSQFKVHRVWNGEFLALLHGTLPKPVVLELEP